VLKGLRLLERLKAFDSVLVGTVPINIDIDTSDLDIVCFFDNKKRYADALKQNFASQQGFMLTEKLLQQDETIIVRFTAGNFSVEIVGQKVPSRQQHAYQHMLKEYEIIGKMGEDFRRKVVELKKKGIKTEPAFALLLGIEGDPYEALLNYKLEVTG
jgi:hypothetical protein